MKIITVMYATFAVAKRKHSLFKKNQPFVGAELSNSFYFTHTL